MPIDRDDHDERLARIEQIIEDLSREVSRFSDFHRRTTAEAKLTRERSQQARTELRKLRAARAARNRR